jgi:DNA ligase-1
MSKEYIIQKAVEVGKVVKPRRLLPDQYGERFMAFRKYDGCCAVLKDGQTFSRTGESYQCLDDVAKYLHQRAPDFVFIGEAWWPGKDQFNLISGAFRRQQTNDDLFLMLHDVIPKSDFDYGSTFMPFLERAYIADELDGVMDDRIQSAKGFGYLGSWAAVQAKCNEIVDEGGYDGLVLRDPNGLWKAGSGTTGEIIKVKRKLSFDLRVLEVNTAIGEKTGRAVYKLVVDFRGSRLGVGSGLPHDAALVPAVGDIVEVEAMDYSSNGLLRLLREPRFKGIRFDKTEPDV